MPVGRNLSEAVAAVRPACRVLVVVTGDVGKVFGWGRDKESGARVVCVELCTREGADRWQVYRPDQVVILG